MGNEAYSLTLPHNPSVIALRATKCMLQVIMNRPTKRKRRSAIQPSTRKRNNGDVSVEPGVIMCS